mmetsp:Transcript_37171/g.52516  ORF Transcript_37171/g.52516 Transcript_37171/m.52516 type:complete len:381 (+) Transcript_37171:45-1187(+)|eukprot:CAMPEP_0202442960 /NCGR_PEP_ID=MMETSP1360-20130828/2313_1 /ASSEMBLY_ACC=CAM_ASM_000848 /TAXON_ID=515479 /ORGANISM="Licmophora paradoxa, Strain CCMP2313" /LENGTH=380 /DNA_ID=CAMNT_0049058495 /DNA_START=44 /DNA_END=1186 /DNA_ORIENTATION=-
MADNPLIGSRISLISKKNIRYEGTLYSINETDATVALQNVKSYGTEGREKMDGATTFVPPQDAIHPYLVFRGSDIKDLHVHEKGAEEAPPPPPPPPPGTVTPAAQPKPSPAAADAVATDPPPAPKTQETTTGTTATKKTVSPPPGTIPNPPTAKPDPPAPPKPSKNVTSPPQPASVEPGPTSTTGPPSKEPPAMSNGSNATAATNGAPRQSRPKHNRGPRKPQHQVGTGASLLNRKERGQVDKSGIETPRSDFDFETNLDKFEKAEEEAAQESTEAYQKDDFFDSISCDALDKERGVDNRLRGSMERNLNTETFGAVALNSNNNRRRGRYRGGGRGRGRGRGRGGRGRGRGRYHHNRNTNGYDNSNNNNNNNRRTQESVS